ncbi:hypothetical protein PHJA_000170300 [Phtheirospermum japonicum]|uniref:Uncharacterized protein n=1 Tax=Phtheirospermum japonicum TaxID=374723 RepID=A0A830B4M8_9LAMI|nr:hypothetical protein PHJA_000170300 [Phtheirospermum japonicum]
MFETNCKTNWSAGIAISPLSYYRCRDNLYQVRTIVDHQIRWSAIFTPAHKHKSSARNIIPKYSKDSNRVNQEGGKTLAEFPNSIELGILGPILTLVLGISLGVLVIVWLER